MFGPHQDDPEAGPAEGQRFNEVRPPALGQQQPPAGWVHPAAATLSVLAARAAHAIHSVYGSNGSGLALQSLLTGAAQWPKGAGW